MKKVPYIAMSEWNGSAMLSVCPESSAVRSLVWYRNLSDGVATLSVKFTSSDTRYDYENVSLSTFQQIINSNSIGKALNELVIRERRGVAA